MGKVVLIISTYSSTVLTKLETSPAKLCILWHNLITHYSRNNDWFIKAFALHTLDEETVGIKMQYLLNRLTAFCFLPQSS
ncbi:hypothetical protein T12_10342 [Trichinella patagoniensis]|uniref:Uncharacterized protein n=1 Tax=Trichinella patagoniensis TaxID=990121 RepID=A0A0V1ABE0_9BILA|nr:hypothetical protein T12_10342 [Trichinella patagoniensis]